MNGTVTPADPLWDRSYPVFRAPTSGESLAGYLLALDHLNGLPAGTTVWAVKRREIGMPRLCTPAPYLRAAWLDLDDIAIAAGGVARSDIDGLTLRPLLRWLWGPSSVTLSASRAFRVCPACAAERQMGLVSLLDQVRGCARHGLAYVDRCGCAETIQPFLGQRAFSCHGMGCILGYEELPAFPLDADARLQVGRVTAVYHDLLARASSDAAHPEGPRHLARALQQLVHLHREGRSELHGLRRRVGGRPGLKVVVAVLLTTGLSAADLAAAIDETRASAEIRATARTASAISRCPNCGGTDLLKCANEHQCRTCGTRFSGSRILFSFDEQPGYSRWRARANARRLTEARKLVRAICADYLAADRTIQREPVLRAGRVPPNSIPHLSQRAGLVAIIAEAQGLQKDARLKRAAAPVPSTGMDRELHRRIELMALAHAIGVSAAGKRLGVARSRYYRWRSQFESGAGQAALTSDDPHGYDLMTRHLPLLQVRSSADVGVPLWRERCPGAKIDARTDLRGPETPIVQTRSALGWCTR